MKTLHRGEWAEVRNMMNKYFAAGRPCSVCGRFACETVWYSPRTGEVRCKRCFDPWE